MSTTALDTIAEEPYFDAQEPVDGAADPAGASSQRQGRQTELKMDLKSVKARSLHFRNTVKSFVGTNKVSLAIVIIPEWDDGEIWEYAAGADWAKVGPREDLEHIYDVVYKNACPGSTITAADCTASCATRYGVKALLQRAVEQGMITQKQADDIYTLPFTAIGQQGDAPGKIDAYEVNSIHACETRALSWHVAVQGQPQRL